MKCPDFVQISAVYFETICTVEECFSIKNGQKGGCNGVQEGFFFP